MNKLFGKYEYPEGLYYSRDHLWAKIEDEKVRVGLTDFARQISGKIRSIRLRPPGRTVEQSRTLGTMETGKWVGPIKSPISGTILENNSVLRRKASLLNEDSYGQGWVSVLQPTNLEEDLKLLMTEIDESWLRQEMEKYGEKEQP
jgi:glycine cleavage system H protein